MANYSYGGLLVNVTADTRSMSRQISQAALVSGEQAASSIASTLGKGLASIGKTAAVGLGTGVGVLTAFGVASFKTAARVDEMNATLEALAKANHLSLPAVQGSVTAIRKQGIEAGVAQSTVAQFAQQHLDLAKSTDLSRVAQDAAVISGQNSSDVLQQLIHGISTQQTDVLRQAGIQVDANKAQADYAKQLHTTVAALTPAQKSQAMLSAVLAQGKDIAGAYAAAMEKPGKVLRSFPRLFDDIKVSVGTGLVDAFGPLILNAYHFTKALDTTLAPGGALAPILTSIGQAATGLVAPLSGVVGKWTDWVKNLKPGQISGIASAIKDFAPEIVAIATALGTFAGGKFTSQIPIVGQMLGNLGGPLGAVTAGVGALVATSPEARAQLGQLAKTVSGSLAPIMKTLAPVVAQVVQFIGPLLTGAIRLLAPMIVTLVSTLARSLVPVISALAPVFLRLAPLVVHLVAVLAGGLLKVIVALAPVLADLAVQLSDTLLQVIPMLIPVVEQLTPLINLLAGILATVLVGALKALAPLLPLLPVVLGAILDVLIPLIPLITLLATWLGKIAPILGPMIAGWILLDLVMSANPFGMVVIGLVAVVTAIKLAYDHFAWFRTIVQAVFGWIAANWPLLLGILTGGIGLAAVFIITHFTQVQAVVLAVVGAITSAIGAAWAWVLATTKSVWSAIAGFFSQIWGAIKAGIGAALEWIKSVVSGAWNWIKANAVATWGAFAGFIGSIWAGIKNTIGAALGWIKQTVSGTWTSVLNTAKDLWGKITKAIQAAWDTIKAAAKDSGGKIIGAMKDGFVAAIKGIGTWLHKYVVDPIVNSVKSLFGIGGGNGGKAPAKGKSGPQGGGGTGGGGPVPDTGISGDDGVGWVSTMTGALGTIVHNAVSSAPLDVAKHVFGSVAEALGWMVVKGMVAIENLGKTALDALGKIPGVAAALSFLSGAWGMVKGWFGGGGGGGVGGLVSRAMGYNGHRYVWGGSANDKSGFDCSSFVNMLAGSLGLPVPGGFRAPSGGHGPVTGNWLTFGALKTVPYDQMAPGDIYVNGHHMGIVTGPGKGFAARSTATGTGPQNVARGAYTIRRFPGGGGGGKGVSGTSSLLAEALAGMLSQKMGNAPVVAGSRSQNLVTIARYMAGHGWSLPAAAGIAGNVYQESMGDPLSFGTGGRGLIGWTPPSRLPNSAFIPGNPSASLSRQLPLVNSFFHSNMGRYIAIANAQSDPGRAALVIMNMGERPAGSSQSNPFFGGSGTSKGSLRASIARQVFEQIKKAGGIKLASGGVIREHIAGVGESGQFYQLGERGAELVSPLTGGGPDLSGLSRAGTVVHVHPRQQQSETEIAAAVSRALAWAQAGGTP